MNFRVTQVLGDIREAFDFVRDRNPRIRFLITVSPVPLVATAEDRHVLVSTVYSKSVLRAVCGELEAQYDDVALLVHLTRLSPATTRTDRISERIFAR